MANKITAVEFSRAWEAAWNARDLEGVLSHFHDDAVFTSPIAMRIGFAPDGIVRGKDALRRYWNAALARNPDLKFKVTAIYEGTDTLVILFRTQKGEDRAEVLIFSHNLVIEGRGTFEAGYI